MPQLGRPVWTTETCPITPIVTCTACPVIDLNPPCQKVCSPIPDSPIRDPACPVCPTAPICTLCPIDALPCEVCTTVPDTLCGAGLFGTPIPSTVLNPTC